MNTGQVLQVSPRAKLWFWRANGLAWLLVGLVIRRGTHGRVRMAIGVLWWALFCAICTCWGVAGMKVEEERAPGPQGLRLPAGMYPFCWAGVSLLGTLTGLVDLLENVEPYLGDDE